MGAPRRLRITTAVAAVATAMAMIIPTTAAVADPGALVFTGTASLPSFPGRGSQGTFSGTATGTSSGPFVATFSYSDITCALGTASGNLNAAGHTAAFQWVRLGSTAIAVLSGGHTGAAVFVFVLTSPAPPVVSACTTGSPVPVTWLVVGSAVFA